MKVSFNNKHNGRLSYNDISNQQGKWFQSYLDGSVCSFAVFVGYDGIVYHLTNLDGICKGFQGRYTYEPFHGTITIEV